jgi:AcrR family transcriptional regulator
MTNPLNVPSDPTLAILAATRQCYLAQGIEKTGMAEVAKLAGVARSTLYRYYPKKDDLLVAVISLEVDATNALIHKKLARFSKPEDIIVEGIIFALKEVPQRPLLEAVFGSHRERNSLHTIWNLMGGALQSALEPPVLQTTVAPEIIAEWVHRIFLSFLSLPSAFIKNDRQLRSTLHALLIPVILQRP